MDKREVSEVVRYFLLALPIVAIAIAFIWVISRREEKVLKMWAEREGYEILKFKRAFFAGGFSIFTTSRSQRVFSVLVRDQSGHERSGWVRCGSYPGGVFFNDTAEVKWKKDSGDCT